MSSSIYYQEDMITLQLALHKKVVVIDQLVVWMDWLDCVTSSRRLSKGRYLFHCSNVQSHAT